MDGPKHEETAEPAADLWLGAGLEHQRGSWKIILFERCCLKRLQSQQRIRKEAEMSWNAVLELLLAFLCLGDGWRKSAPLEAQLELLL